MTIGVMQTSIHGNRLGLDSEDNLILKGNGQLLASSDSFTTAVSTATTYAASFLLLTTSTVGYSIADPVVGKRMTIIAANASTGARFIQTSTVNGVTLGTTGAFNKWTSTQAGSLQLIGVSTTAYAILSNTNASSVSTAIGGFTTI